jgi:hypothetical protein
MPEIRLPISPDKQRLVLHLADERRRSGEAETFELREYDLTKARPARPERLKHNER